MQRLAFCLAILACAAPSLAQDLGPSQRARERPIVRQRSLQADQLRYERYPAEGGLRIDADWVEPDGTSRHLSYRLPRPALSEDARTLSPPGPARQQEVGIAAAERAARQAPPGVTLRVIARPSGIQVAASGPQSMDLNGPTNRVTAAYSQAIDQAILEAGYLRHGEHVIEPDYRGLVTRHAALLRVTAQDIAQATRGMAQRERVGLLLGFVQSVPYSTLHARGVSALRTPAGVLAEDRGDCDEKSVTLATLLAVTDPDLSSVLVVGDNHAFLGVSLTPQPGDVAVTVGGRPYVMIEPVGPGWFPVGKLSGMSLAILQNPGVQAVVVTGGGG